MLYFKLQEGFTYTIWIAPIFFTEIPKKTAERDEDEKGERKFKLPKRPRGGLGMERSQIPIKEHTGSLNMNQWLNIDKSKKVMTESFPEEVLKDIDGRSATEPAWQQRSLGNKLLKGYIPPI